MPTIKELRLRIKSLQNTSKITSAMKMVSAARLRRAQDAFNRNRPYAEKMQELLEQVTASFQDLDHPLMKVREEKNASSRSRVRYIVVASDRGLCGSFNNNLLKFFTRTMAESAKVNEALGLGRRAKDFVIRSRVAAKAAEALSSNVPTYANALEIAQNAIQDFISGDVDAVYLVYNRYNSVLSQTPIQVKMLPFSAPKKVSAKKEKADGHGAAAAGFRLDYIVEPNAADVFAELLPKLVTIQVLKALLENAVGEHTARMTAMDAATKNTRELIGSLTLKMNRARQAAITKELIEIVSGAEALNG
ncbi:MAG: synthase gamma chain [Fibrobacteres bacterium]|nr:synthase gamma chain [Fibrobacterota bacterium]